MSVDGTEIPVSLSSFNELSIVENISVKLPTLKFLYSDTTEALIKNPLIDDAKLGIVLHSANYNDPEQPLEFTFRVKGAEYKPSGNRILVRAVGIFDKLEYLRKIQKLPVEGNSNDAIKKIASQNGFGKFDLDSANDKQWWRPKGSMMFVEQFARHAATHGMVDKKSVMSLGVSDDGTLHYKNVAKLAEKSGTRTITEVDRVNADNGDVPLIEWSVKSLGGLINSMTGYGSEVIQEKLTGASDLINEIIAPMMGGALNMSSGTQKSIGSVMRTFVPTDLKNCQTGDTLIPTEYGLLRIDDLSKVKKGYKPGYRENLKIKIGSRYKPEYTKSWIYNGKQSTLSITTAIGNKLNCTNKHPNLVLDKTSGDLYWKMAKDCKINDILCINKNQITRNSKLKLNLIKFVGAVQSRKDVTIPSYMTTELAFIIGLLVSEGHINNKYAVMSNSDLELNTRYSDLVKVVFGINTSTNICCLADVPTIIQGVTTKSTKVCYSVSIGSKEIVSYLNQLGLYSQVGLINNKKASHYKYIPWSILQADAESQLSFLAAYLEGDGSIDNKTGRISWYSASNKLMREMQILLNSHGFTPHLRKERTAYGLTLNASQSKLLWRDLKKYMVTKNLLVNNVPCLDGVPIDFCINTIKSRRIYPAGKARMHGCFYLNDKNTIVNIEWKKEGLKTQINNIMSANTAVFTYQDYKEGKLDKFLSLLKVISKSTHKKLVNLLKLEYKFTKIIKIEKSKKLPVYDLSMKDGVEPAFIANGLIIHNTHEKFYQAREQNVRGLQQLQSTSVECTTNQATGLKIYDVIDFKPHLPSSNELFSLVAGSYIITSKTRYFSGARFYREKFTLCRNSFSNSKGQVGYSAS